MKQRPDRQLDFCVRCYILRKLLFPCAFLWNPEPGTTCTAPLSLLSCAKGLKQSPFIITARAQFSFLFLYFRGLAMPLDHKTFGALPVQINKATVALRKGRVRSARCTRPRCPQSQPSRRRPRPARTPPSGCGGEERERLGETSHKIPALGLEELICFGTRHETNLQLALSATRELFYCLGVEGNIFFFVLFDWDASSVKMWLYLSSCRGLRSPAGAALLLLRRTAARSLFMTTLASVGTSESQDLCLCCQK